MILCIYLINNSQTKLSISLGGEEMKDRFTRGFMAGVIAGLISAVWNLGSYYFNMSTLRFLDFAAILTYGRRTRNAWEAIFSWAATVFFYGLLGIIFVYLITLVTSENLFFKGSIYGITSWFTIYAITYLFKVPELSQISFLTTLSNFIGSVIYGVVLGYAVKILDLYREVKE